jgi:hypothetical protein
MAMDRFTLFGLAVALLGWIVLVSDATVTPFFFAAGNMAAVASLRSDVFSVAETTIVSGFGLAIIGVLRSGFGALHRFFDTVLERASTPRQGAATPRQPAAAAAYAEHAGPHAQAPVVTVDAEPIETIEPIETVERPAPKPARPHNYVILANGAVEVDTLLGTRVFASLDEARDYIR